MSTRYLENLRDLVVNMALNGATKQEMRDIIAHSLNVMDSERKHNISILEEKYGKEKL